MEDTEGKKIVGAEELPQEILIHTITGTIAPQTVKGTFSWHFVIVIIDFGSTNSFINIAIVKRVGLTIQGGGGALKLMVASKKKEIINSGIIKALFHKFREVFDEPREHPPPHPPYHRIANHSASLLFLFFIIFTLYPIHTHCSCKNPSTLCPNSWAQPCR